MDMKGMSLSETETRPIFPPPNFWMTGLMRMHICNVSKPESFVHEWILQKKGNNDLFSASLLQDGECDQHFGMLRQRRRLSQLGICNLWH